MAPKFDFAADGLKKLDEYLLTRTYLEGWKIGEADKSVLSTCPAIDAVKYPHAYRWYLHITALTGGSAIAPPVVAVSSSSKKVVAEDDFDDMFGDDEPEADDLAAKKKAALEKVKADKAAAKAKAAIQRTQIVFDVKVWEAETDLDALYKEIKKITIDGLQWGEAYDKKAVAFGIFKLVITCVIEDEKVCVDDITEPIEALDEFVQSVDMLTMNRL